MENQELISIIVPIYKTEKFLPICIDSLINQTYKNIEILLIDDGSPDNSGKICDEYLKKDSRIKVIHQKNQGVSVARNSGIIESTGKWIVFVDGDDYAESEMIQRLYYTAKEKDCDIVFGNYYILTEKNKSTRKYFTGDLNEILERDKKILLKKCMENLGVPWGKIYKKELITKNNILFKPQLKRMQDSIFNLYAFQLAKKIEYVEDCLYNYRQFLESACYKYNPSIDVISKEILNEINIFIDKYNLSQELREEYYKKCVKLYIEILKLKYIPIEVNYKYKDIIFDLKSLKKEELYSTAIKKCKFKGLNSNYKIGLLLLKLNFINLIYLYYKIIYIWKNKINYK